MYQISITAQELDALPRAAFTGRIEVIDKVDDAFFDACRFAEGEAGEHSRCLKKLGADEVWALMDGEEESDA